MNNNKLIKISSITKKLLVALLGAFLMVFVLFHACANLFILAKDGGDAYSAFCHFMGTNVIIKIFEIVLLGAFLFHIIITVWLWFLNRQSRPVRYHERSRTRTAKGSKLAIITGSLLLVCVLFHFYDFYFVKHGFVKGEYMVKTVDLASANPQQQMSDESMMVLMNAANEEGKLSKDGQWLRKLSAEEVDALKKDFPADIFEPDFYNMARQKFSVWHIVLCYIVFFFLVGLHLRHGFESAFQTFGLNSRKYSKLIEVIGIIYCWVVCLIFTIVPVFVFLGF